ncbi:MAG: hypothetical protein RL417_1376 [Pseudomonadota bacterium]|jgi:acetyltransferase-like isoleucine patch superfamily enzyme
MKPAMTPQQERFADESRSGLAAYRELAIGSEGLPFLVWYEILMCLVGNLPGLPGFGLRSLLYPTLFGTSGSRPAIGRGVVIRNPRKISLGRRVMIDDYAVLDVRGEAGGLSLADHVSVGRFTTVAAKGGRIDLAPGVNIGSYCRIATQSNISLGESVLIAAYCYIGPGNHQSGDSQTPLIAREMENRGGVSIGAHAWIGAHSTVLDGVTIGPGAIVGAHSLVREDVPPGAVVAGAPARLIRSLPVADAL